jgi:uncharacterized Rmd1/YagE family protein
MQAIAQHFASNREEYRVENKSPGVLSRKLTNGRVFYFEMGSVVCWGTSPTEDERLLREMESFSIGSHSKITETVEFEFTTQERTVLNPDMIQLVCRCRFFFLSSYFFLLLFVHQSTVQPEEQRVAEMLDM